jgi:hypothetical protein
MANGRKGDDPFMDILYHKIQRFSPTADALIAEIVQLGGKKELEKAFNLKNRRQFQSSKSPYGKFASDYIERPKSGDGRFNG